MKRGKILGDLNCYRNRKSDVTCFEKKRRERVKVVMKTELSGKFERKKK